MPNRKPRRRVAREGPIESRIMGFLAAMLFAAPTAGLLWLITARELSLSGTGEAFVSWEGFWLVLGSFAVLALLFPGLFPALLGKLWRLLIKLEL